MSGDDTTAAIGGAEGTPSGVPTFTSAGDDQQSIARQLVSLQKERPEILLSATNAVQTDTQRKILLALADKRGGATYDEVEAYTTVSRRTVRKHASKLEENDLIDRVDSKTTAFSFTSFEVSVIVTHVLECYFNMDMNEKG